MAQKVDWKKIEKVYITGTSSYAELAKEYQICKSTIEKKGKDNDWVKKRRKYRCKVVAKSVEKTQAREVDKLVNIREATDNLSEIVNDFVKDSKNFTKEYYETQPGGKKRKKVKANAFAIKNMTDAIVNLTKVIRDVYGMPNYIEQENMTINRERLEFEKEKSMLGGPDEGETGVVLIAPVLEEQEEEVEEVADE